MRAAEPSERTRRHHPDPARRATSLTTYVPRRDYDAGDVAGASWDI
jgi:hypothetical protein